MRGIRSKWVAAAGIVSAAALTVSTLAAPASQAVVHKANTCTRMSNVKLQLQWFVQAQFAGYYAALDNGYYKAQCLNVTIVEGGVDIVPQTVLAQGAVDYAVSWVPKALASRQQGADITDVAQVFQRSGTRQIAFKSSGVTTNPASLKGKTVGNWGFGNEFELFAGLTKAGLNPASDVNLVQQQFDMKAFLAHQIDAAQAMTYNEYAQVLESVNPATGKLYQPSDLVVIDWNKAGTAMYNDAIWAKSARLMNDPAYQAQTQKFVQASLQGWIYCRDHAQQCANIILKHGSKLGASHQLWMMNEINKLIWPSPLGVGVINPVLWAQTVKVALNAKNLTGATVITKAPDNGAYTNKYAIASDKALKAQGLNTTGLNFKPITVTLKPNGA